MVLPTSGGEAEEYGCNYMELVIGIFSAGLVHCPVIDYVMHIGFMHLLFQMVNIWIDLVQFMRLFFGQISIHEI